MSSPTFLIIDGHALLYRAYHAFPELSTSQGVLVNAVFGFTRILLTSIRDFEPEYIAVAFDHPQKTKRAEAYAEYKAHREAMPDDLIPQVELVKNVVSALNIPQFELAGYEADDLIGTLTRLSEAKAMDQVGAAVMNIVVTGDKDLFQLVSDQTHVFIPGRGQRSVDVEYDAEAVHRKMGVTHQQIVDMKALMGDPSDNIPGVKGVGQKTAVKLLTEFGTLEKLYQAVERVNEGSGSPAEQALLKGALLKKLTSDHDAAVMSQELATIIRDVPDIELDLPACRVTGYDRDQAEKVLESLEFETLFELLPRDNFEIDIHQALF